MLAAQGIRDIPLRPNPMPTYDYECDKCGSFEVFQSMKDDKLTVCPKEDCDGAVKRLLGTGAGLIFKGSGFYQTDYRSDSYKAGAKKDSSSGDKKSDSSSGEKKTEGKPKTESKPKTSGGSKE